MFFLDIYLLLVFPNYYLHSKMLRRQFLFLAALPNKAKDKQTSIKRDKINILWKMTPFKTLITSYRYKNNNWAQAPDAITT